MDVSPPGLREANLPSVSATGKGKIAITYMGSTNSPNDPSKGRCGNNTDPANPCPQSAEYAGTTWNGYMTISTNGDSKAPVFYTGTANHPRDPIYRGVCGPGRCGAVYDFIDIEIDREGIAWAAFVDACQVICIQGGSNVGNEGIVGSLVGGPRLR